MTRAAPLALLLSVACDDVPTLDFDGGADAATEGSAEGSASEGGAGGDAGDAAATDAACPGQPPPWATTCCGALPCAGATCCGDCETKCMPGDLCCANMGTVVCRKNMTTCP